jgi:hypothetical protein
MSTQIPSLTLYKRKTTTLLYETIEDEKVFCWDEIRTVYTEMKLEQSYGQSITKANVRKFNMCCRQ